MVAEFGEEQALYTVAITCHSCAIFYYQTLLMKPESTLHISCRQCEDWSVTWTVLPPTLVFKKITFSRAEGEVAITQASLLQREIIST